MKSPTFWIIIIEGEENYSKGIENVYSKIIEGNYQNLEKEMPMQRKEVYRIMNKILKIQNNETVLEDSREKDWVIYKNRSIKIIPDYLKQIFKVRRDWKEYFMSWKIITLNMDYYTQQNYQLKLKEK